MPFDISTLITIVMVMLIAHIVSAILFYSTIQKDNRLTHEQKKQLNKMNILSPIWTYVKWRGMKVK